MIDLFVVDVICFVGVLAAVGTVTEFVVAMSGVDIFCVVFSAINSGFSVLNSTFVSLIDSTVAVAAVI